MDWVLFRIIAEAIGAVIFAFAFAIGLYSLVEKFGEALLDKRRKRY